MAILTFPALSPASVQWSLVPNTQAFKSPLDGSVQTAERPGARWVAGLDFPISTEDNARTLIAFLTRLRGSSGRFYLPDHALPAPRGIATGTPLVNGAAQSGGSLITDGWTPSKTGILKAGDMIGFGTNSELHMVVADVNSDAGGNATLTIEPPIRTSPANNAAIDVSSPPAVMRLIDDGQASWRVNPGPIYQPISFKCVEVFQ